MSKYLITENNPLHKCYGGWGPHLRSVVTDTEGHPWFAIEEERNSIKKEALNYLKFDGEKWSAKAKNDLSQYYIGQRMAHFMSNDVLFSYGIDYNTGWVIESYCNTKNPAQSASNAIHIGSQPLVTPKYSNYIGAALSPSGYKLIWWTTTGLPGQFHYIWNFGTGWNGPISCPIIIDGNHYEYIGYAHAAFKTDSEIELAAQTGIFQSGEPYYLSVNISILIDNNLKPPQFSIIGDQSTANTTRSIWCHPNTGDQHALTFSFDGNVHYFYQQAKGKLWVEIKDQTLSRVSAARYFFDHLRQKLFLAYAPIDERGIKVCSLSLDQIKGPLNWKEAKEVQLDLPEDWHYNPCDLYIPSRIYQNTDFRNVHLGAVGSNVVHNGVKKDNEIYHYKLHL